MSYVNFVPILIIKIMLPSETKIIFHGHSMGIDNENVFIKVIKTCIHKIGRHVIPILCDGFLCCSNDAGKWMFTEKTRKRNVYKIAHNAIDITPFLFQKTVRTSIREKLKIRDDDIVIGNIGRFTYQKNHEFLIDVFDKCLLMNPRYKLMLIGDGPNKEMIEKKVSALGIEDRVMFLGVRKDVHKLLQAMDIFCLPSRFEGLGIVGIEAQASGLTCLVSDVVPKDLGVTDKCKFLSLNSDLWLSEILKYDVCNPLDRMNTLYPIKNAGYEINDEIKEMVRYYNSLVKM